MSDQPQGPGWWQASDYKWYPPQPPAAPAYQQPPPSYQAPTYPPQAPGFPPAGPQYYAPAPKKASKAGWFIAAAIVGVLVLLGGCVALVLGATKSAVDDARENKATVVGSTVPGAPDASTPPPAEGHTAGSREQPVDQMTNISLGNQWTFRVDSADVSPAATDAALAANPFNEPPEAGFRYIVVTITAVYEGRDDTPTESPALGFTLSVFGSDNVERNSYDAFVVPPDPALDQMSELAPHGAATGNIVFRVGADETDLVLRARPALTFDSSEAWIRLG